MSLAGKPTTAKGKRHIEDREPKAFENAKSAMFIKGNKSSQTIQDVLRDLVCVVVTATKQKNPFVGSFLLFLHFYHRSFRSHVA
jgi:hypothetical protein